MRSRQVHSLPQLKPVRRQLRRQLTPAEALLWKCLQRRQLAGRRFERQHSIGPYVVDFYCASENLIVELDGHHHFDSAGMRRDAERDAQLRALGYQVLRIENKHVMESLSSVLAEIRAWFRSEA